MLNYSVFFYEVMNDIAKAVETAHNALDAAINDIEFVEGDEFKDQTTII